MSILSLMFHVNAMKFSQNSEILQESGGMAEFQSFLCTHISISRDIRAFLQGRAVNSVKLGSSQSRAGGSILVLTMLPGAAEGSRAGSTSAIQSYSTINTSHEWQAEWNHWMGINYPEFKCSWACSWTSCICQSMDNAPPCQSSNMTQATTFNSL